MASRSQAEREKTAINAASAAAQIDDDATRVYLALLRMAQPSRELLLAQGMTSARLDAALVVLEGRGLVMLDGAGGIDVPPPMTAIPRHAHELERRATAARAAAHELTQVYNSARTRQTDSHADIAVLQELHEVADASNLVVSRAVATIKALRGMTTRTRILLDAPLSAHREPTVGAAGQPVAMLTIWDSQVLELPGAMDVLAARAEGGEVQRFVPLVPLTVMVVDDTACLIEWSRGDDGPQGILGSTPAAVAAGESLFDRFWQLATPTNRRPVASDLDSRDATILRLLAAGVPDASIARQTGFSQRTVERRIRHLMDQLGAQTRFQTGVQAVHRGWL